MTETKPTPKAKPIDEVLLRSYPKVIFFYPLLVASIALWIIQGLMAPDPIAGLGYFWIAVFFINLFVIAFDFSSTKFFVLILAIIVVILLIAFLVLPSIEMPSTEGIEFNIGLTANFYMVMTIILGLILGFTVLANRFDYWKVERNEIYHKKGVFSAAERYPVKSLRLHKDIPDVFEFIALRAGSITLMPGHGEVIHLSTVLNVNKRAEEIDYLLSHMKVEIDQLDQG